MRWFPMLRPLALLLPLALLVAPALATHLPAPTFAVHAAPSTLPGAGSAWNPDVGVNWNTGATLYNGGDHVYRVSPPAWALVTPPANVVGLPQRLFTDPLVGRTWVAEGAAACKFFSLSDNDGATWSPAGGACVGADAFSHASGPRVPGAAYPRSLYACGFAGATQCARSDDGGLTFGAPAPVPCGFVNAGPPGDVHVGPDGTVYVPFAACGTVAGVGVSTNHGLTFVSRAVPGAATPAAGLDPDVATGADAAVWVAYPTSGNGPGVARSADRGVTWTNFGDVGAAAGVRSASHLEMVAGDADRAAVVYLGSTTDGNPHAAGFGGVWRLYVSWTDDGGATWGTTLVSNDIVQRGWICADGSACGSGRNLGERIDAQVDAQGDIVIAYVDGCIGACTSGAGPSNASWAVLAYQTGGTDLFAP